MAVSIVEATYKDCLTPVEEALTQINYIPQKPRVFIKPNVVNTKLPKTGIVTHPKLVEAIIIYLLNGTNTDEIVIGESSVVGVNTNESFRKAGYNDLARKYGIQVLDLNKAERVKIRWKYGELGIPRIIFDYEYINVPKMKTHNQTSVTLCLKNQKGLLSPKDKMFFHKVGLHEPIKELAKAVIPDLNIVDGITCMEGNGPSNGKKKTMNLIIAGQNLIEVDNVCLKIMGFNVDEIKHMIPMEKLEIKGLPLQNVKTKFLKAPDHTIRLNTHLWFKNACSGCIVKVGSAIKQIPKHPKATLNFLHYGIFNRLNIFAGIGHSISESEVYGKVVCVGDCTKRFAEENNLAFVSGCPPNKDEILKGICSKHKV